MAKALLGASMDVERQGEMEDKEMLYGKSMSGAHK